MSCESCFYDGNRYEFFVSNNADFNHAQNICEENGGSLAKHLDKPACIELHKCCHDGNQYRIGLIADDKCSNHRPTTPFRWIGEDSCKDSSPFENINPTLDCQAASISLSNHVDGNLPQALLEDCGNKIKYICQYPQIVTTNISVNQNFTTQSTITSPTSLSIAALTSHHNLYSTQKITSTTSLSRQTTQIQAVMIAGVTCGVLILMMLLVVFLWSYKKKRIEHKNTKIVEAAMPVQPTDVNDIEHHVYDQ